MRVYTRSENQSLVIGRNVIITVLRVFPDHVRIGITMLHDGPGEPDECGYWETDLFLPEDTNLEDVELELSLR